MNQSWLWKNTNTNVLRSPRKILFFTNSLSVLYPPVRELPKNDKYPTSASFASYTFLLHLSFSLQLGQSGPMFTLPNSQTTVF